jgi:hypothetical protein
LLIIFLYFETVKGLGPLAMWSCRQRGLVIQFSSHGSIGATVRAAGF